MTKLSVYLDKETSPDSSGSTAEKITVNGDKVVIRENRIDSLSTLMKTLGQKHNDWEDLEIYCDTLCLDFSRKEKFIIDVTDRKKMCIFARHIKCKGNGPLVFYAHDKSANVEISLLSRRCELSHIGLVYGSVSEYSNRVIPIEQPLETPIDFSTYRESNNSRVRPDKHYFSVNSQITFDGNITTKPQIGARHSGEVFHFSKDFYWSIIDCFDRAISERHSSTVEKLRWVLSVTEGIRWPSDVEEEMAGLSIQAQGLLNALTGDEASQLVPKLSLDSYINTISKRVEQAKHIETNYNNFVTLDATLESRKASGKLIIENAKHNTSAIAENIKIAKIKLENLKQNIALNIDAFNRQKLGLRTKNADKSVESWGKLESARVDFEKALDKKKDDLTVKSWLSIFKAIKNLGMAINGEIVEFAEFASEVNTLNTLQSQLDNLAYLTSISSNSVKEICNQDALQNTFKESLLDGTQVVDENIKVSESICAKDWNALSNNWVSTLLPYTVNNEENAGLFTQASNFMTQGKTLFDYGKALSESFKAFNTLKLEVLNLLAIKANSTRQENKLNELIESSLQNQGDVKEAAYLLRQRYLAIKRTLCIDINNFNAAFNYWAVKTPDQPGELLFDKHICGPSGLASIIPDLDDKLTSALHSFSSRNENIVCQIYHPLTQQDIDVLMSGKRLYITVNVADPTFNGFDRIRVNHIAVVVDGLTNGNEQKTFYFKISNNGLYDDKLYNKVSTYAFLDEMSCFYSAKAGAKSTTNGPKKHYVINDDDIIPNKNILKNEDVFHTPTIFTTWALEMPQSYSDNATLDLSAASALRLMFHGTAMGSKD